MTEKAKETGKGRPLAWIAALLAVLVAGLIVRVNVTLHRPFEHDEISSANAYSSIGYIDTISQLYAERRLDVRRLAAGLSRSLIDWRNPNNHVIQEEGISVAVFFLGASEATVRAAALAAAIGSALLLMVWARRKTGSVLIAAFCGLAICLHPYFICYGETARGYSFATLLLIIQILLLDTAEAGKRGWLRLAISILVSFALFLNLTSLLVIWLAPLYICLVWKELLGNRATESGAGLSPRIRSEPFGWWFFQAFAVGALIFFFCLEHLPSLINAQADYGAKFASHGGAVMRLLGVLHYLFPGTWMLIAVAGAAGWFCMLRSREWLAGPMAGSFILALLYAAATRTVPYDRTFGIWIVFALMGCAWLWKQWLPASPATAAPLRAWLLAGIAALMLVSTRIGPHPVPFQPGYADPAAEIQHQIQVRGETPAGTLVVIPFLTYEETRLYLPDDPAFLSPLGKSGNRVSIYLPCDLSASAQFGFRTTYYHRASAEMVYFELPQNWRAGLIWRKGDFGVVRLNAACAPDAAAISDQAPQIVAWSAANSFFDLQRYIGKRLLANPGMPELHFVQDYYSPTPTLLFFVNGDGAAVRQVISDLEKTTPGTVQVLTPG